MLVGICSGAGWFAVFLAVHIAWFHRTHVEDAYKWIIKMLLICVVADTGTILVWNWGTHSGEIAALMIFYGVLVMACLFILYMPFYYTVVASLSIQTLICLKEAPLKTLTLTDLRQRFASRDIVAERLKIMESNGYLERVASGYRITPKARIVSGFFGFLKALWKLGSGG